MDFAHTTHREMEWIDSAGVFTNPELPQPSPEEILSGYIKGCMKRNDWTGLDKKYIINHAYSRLSKIKLEEILK